MNIIGLTIKDYKGPNEITKHSPITFFVDTIHLVTVEMYLEPCETPLI